MSDSGPGGQWGGRVTGRVMVDTPRDNSMISIPSQRARTDPPDKRRSVGDGPTFRKANTKSTPPPGTSSSSPPQTTPTSSTWLLRQPREKGPGSISDLPSDNTHQTQQWQQQQKALSSPPQQQQQLQQQEEDLQRRQSQQQQQERPVSLNQYWIQSQLLPIQQQQEQLQENNRDYFNSDTQLSLTRQFDNQDLTSNALGNYTKFKGNGGTLGLREENNGNNVTSLQQGISAGNVGSSDFSPSLSRSTPPRFTKCKRQGRVHSSDELKHIGDIEPASEDIVSEKEKRDSQNENRYKFFLDGHPIDLSVDEACGRRDRKSDSYSGIEEIQTNAKRDSSQSKDDIIRREDRFSADVSSIQSLATSDGGQTDSRASSKREKKEKKKKKQKKHEGQKSKSCLSHAGGTDSHHGRAEDKSDRKDKDDGGTDSRRTSGASSTKGPRRLAKRGIGMFPSSNWRRLRNTLKAANEMQGTKKHKHPLTREDSFLRKFSTRNHQNVQNASNSTDEDASRHNFSSSGKSYEGRFVIQHDGNFMFYWLGIVTLSVLYNLWTCIAREAFTEIQQGCPACWYSLDALFDIIYICDIIVQFRTGYLDQGLMVYDSKLLRDKYTQSKVVYVDFLSLLPLDLVQIGIGIHPMIRFPRFLKIYRAFRFLHMLESRTAYPNLIRVTNLTHILFLGAHWFAAFYYMISEAEGFTGEWAYPKPVGEFANVHRKYLRSLFWSTLTLTTIGDLPPPDNSNEYVFVIVSYLIGVFVFATIVGQVGNVINNRNASRQEFERLLDGAKIYMQTHNVPPNLQKRVQRWYDYVWSRGRLNGCDINSLGLLPDKLKTELAIHVNLETLKKVTIFQECQPEFLHDLVLKMKAYIFTPGDLICRRGEVAREMFIIADGVVEIISESGVMLKRMGAGDFFGEIGILNLDGGINRRTADVRSVGYLELFVLSREDVLAALKDHPEAESIIRDYGQRRLREVEAHRQKLKPCRGSTDQQAAGGQTVQNRLLQTLRSLNPAVRRLSSQINHHPGSPPGAGQPGNGSNAAGSQRCVTVQSQQRSSPVNKAMPGLAKASANTRAGDVPCDSVSSEQVDVPGEPVSVRFPGNYSGRRRSFGYFRTAYARFRNVFHKRRSQRRSVDMFDSTSRELWGTRSSDEQQGSDDQTGKGSSLKGGYNVTLNVEKCSANSSSDNPSNEEEEIFEKEAEERGSLFPSAKRGSLLLGLQDLETRKTSSKYGKGAYRKLSEPVTYMSVCTEDLDEQFTSRSQDDVQADEKREDTSKVMRDVRIIGQIMEADGSPPEGDKSLSDAPCTYKKTSPSFEAADNSFTPSTVPLVADAENLSFNSKAKSQINKDDPGEISPRDSSNDSGNDARPRSVSFSLKNEQISDLNKVSSVGTDSEVSEMMDISATGSASSGSQRKAMCVTAPPERAASSCLSVPTSNSDSGICGNTENQPPEKSFRSSSPTDTQAMQSISQQRRKSSSPLRLSQISNLTHTSSDSSDDIVSRTESPTNSDDTTNDTAALTRGSSLHHASVSPFSLSCHCNPADNFTKFISSHLPETFHQRLIKKKRDVMATHLMSASSPKLNTKFPKANDTDRPRRSVRLPPCSPTLSSRSHSFPTLSESFPQTDISGFCASRRSSSEGDKHFSFEERVADRSPKLERLHQNSTKSMDRDGSYKGGRSHAMSIIQTPASDLSYQQITAQIQTMQGMIDKRLTQLEEVYSSTTERLDKLAASQDMLVRLLKQQLLSHPDRNRASLDDDELLTASRV